MPVELPGVGRKRRPGWQALPGESGGHGRERVSVRNGDIWLDDEGRPIQAHGGMIARFGEKWYWYGENKDAPNCPGTTRVDVIGVSCYSSADLHAWQDRKSVV